MFKPASYIPKLFNPLPKVDPSPCLEQFMSTHLDKYCAEINDAKEDADLSNIYSRVSNLLVQNFLKVDCARAKRYSQENFLFPSRLD